MQTVESCVRILDPGINNYYQETKELTVLEEENEKKGFLSNKKISPSYS